MVRWGHVGIEIVSELESPMFCGDVRKYRGFLGDSSVATRACEMESMVCRRMLGDKVDTMWCGCHDPRRPRGSWFASPLGNMHRIL